MSHPLIVTAMLFVLARARHGHAPQNRSFSPLGTQNAQIAREWTAAARDPERMMSMLERGGEPPPLGRALRAYFPVQDNMILFNTCREGHPPIPVLDAVRGYDVAWDTERFEVDEALFRRVKASLSNLVGTGPQNIRLIPSVAVGVATVIRSLRVPKDKKILYLSSEFYVCTDILRRLEELSGRELLLEVKISPPFSANRVVKSVRAALESNPNGIYAAFFSNPMKTPGMLLPVKRITKMLHDHGSLAIVDGAHSLGQISVDVEDMEVDVWMSTVKKWLFSPRGTGVMYVRPGLKDTIEQVLPGAHDCEYHRAARASPAPFFAIPTALRFRRWIGGERALRAYSHYLAHQAADILSGMLQVSNLTVVDGSEYANTLYLKLPGRINLVNGLFERFGIDVGGPFNELLRESGMWPNDQLIRICIQPFHDVRDIVALGHALRILLA